MDDPNLLQIDAFADGPFTGNPAAVVLDSSGATDSWMQSFAGEMNLAETAFLEKRDSHWQIRWFTPAVEVDLCGHATLAAAHALWETGRASPEETIRFESRSGTLEATRAQSLIWLDFPAEPVDEITDAAERATLLEALGLGPDQAPFAGRNRFDALVHLADAAGIPTVEPDFAAIARLPFRGIILTAAAPEEHPCDFLSRFFAPATGIDEDPVTGSAHCALAPFWSQRLGENELTGYQASPRGGQVRTRYASPRVSLGGKAVTVFRGRIAIATE